MTVQRSSWVVVATWLLATPVAFAGGPRLDSGSAGAKVRVAAVSLGSGVPAVAQWPADSPADHVADGDFHVPGVLPGHPTAASLWPRVVRVPCQREAGSGEVRCGGYDIAPMRGEYIYLRPVVVSPAPEPKPLPRRPAPAPTRKKPLG